MIARFRRSLLEPIEYEYIHSTDECGGRDVFEVIGSRGNLYEVSVYQEKKCDCTCADFRIRGSLCKHVILILMKHYNCSFGKIKKMTDNPYLGLNDVVNATSLCGDDCPICFGECSTDEWSCEQCCKNVHLNCVANWLEICRKQGMNPSCPMCRYPITEM